MCNFRMAYIGLMVKLFITTVGLRREARPVAFGERLRQLNLFTLTSFEIFIVEIDMCSPDFFPYHPTVQKTARALLPSKNIYPASICVSPSATVAAA